MCSTPSAEENDSLSDSQQVAAKQAVARLLHGHLHILEASTVSPARAVTPARDQPDDEQHPGSCRQRQFDRALGFNRFHRHL
jgi:hypothetical protein